MREYYRQMADVEDKVARDMLSTSREYALNTEPDLVDVLGFMPIAQMGWQQCMQMKKLISKLLKGHITKEEFSTQKLHITMGNLDRQLEKDYKIPKSDVSSTEEIGPAETLNARVEYKDTSKGNGFHYGLGTGVRKDQGKARYDLLPAQAIEDLVKVLTMGANKYADRNWERGMDWSRVIGSLKRHIAAFEKGEDYDPESGMLHVAHAMCNAMFLTQYYHTFPQGDNRAHKYLYPPKIGLDVDEVLADWVGAWTTKFGQEVPETWNFDRNIKEKFDALKDDKEFWLSIPVKTKPSDIHFEPHCYITSRSIPTEWTQEWLDKNGFPTMPVYTVPNNTSKVEVAKKSGIDIFVDDRYENFVELNRAGICCFLYDQPHNRRYDVGYKRIYSLQDLPV